MPTPQSETPPGRTITAMREQDLADLFRDLPSVESIETGREDGSGNWVSGSYGKQYTGHTFARIYLKDDADVRGEAYERAETAGHVVMGVGRDFITVREGRDPHPEHLAGLDAWDTLVPGDRFKVGMSVEHEAIDVHRDPDDPETVRRVEAVAVYRLENDNYDEKVETFNDATFNRIRRIQQGGSSARESRNVTITEMNGEFIVPDEA